MKILTNKQFKSMIDYQAEQLRKICNLQEEIERLKERLDIAQTAYLSLDEKINKAIEYIEEDIRGNYFKRYDDEVYKMCEDLLGILKGDDNNE